MELSTLGRADLVEEPDGCVLAEVCALTGRLSGEESRAEDRVLAETDCGTDRGPAVCRCEFG